MTFKDALKDDFKTFLDLTEFGEIIEMDGVLLPAVIQKSTGEFNKATPSARNNVQPPLHNEPLIGDLVTVYFKAADYRKKRGRLPQHSEFVRIDGKRYKVLTARDEMGIFKMECTADRMPNPKMAKLPGLYEP